MMDFNKESMIFATSNKKDEKGRKMRDEYGDDVLETHIYVVKSINVKKNRIEYFEQPIGMYVSGSIKFFNS